MKGNWPVIGNKAIIDFLRRNISAERIVHAYLFIGPKQVGKRTVANIFCKTFFCNDPASLEKAIPCGNCKNCQQFEKGIHSDFLVLSEEKNKKNISIENVRLFQHDLNTTSLLGNIKIGVIDDAGALSEEAANALLKTLEEPPNKSVIILITQSQESLPVTIVSRCQILNFHSVSRSEISSYLENNLNCSLKTAKKIAAYSLGRPGRAINFFKHSSFLQKYEEISSDFLNIFQKGIPFRFSLVKKYLEAESFQEKTKETEEIINILQLIFRDIILIKENNLNRIIHFDQIKKLNQIASAIPRNMLSYNLNELVLFQQSLNNNMNPQLALENYFLNLKTYA